MNRVFPLFTFNDTISENDDVFVGVLIVFANKIKNDKFRTARETDKDEYSNYLNELFERYAIDENKKLNSTTTTTSITTNSISKQEQQKQIREALMKGYVEMSHINLTICTECQQAEYEAQHTTERLVSGG